MFQLDDSKFYIENGCFTKHLFINGCLGFQARKIVQPTAFQRKQGKNNMDMEQT